MARRSHTLLVVEDDHRIRLELLEALRNAGFEAEVAVSLRDARTAVEREFAAVVLDLGLPDGDGLDLVRELRAEGRGIPILILTARDAAEQRVEGLEAGADDYVVKPFHTPEFVARVRNLLKRAGRSFGEGPVLQGDLKLDPESRRSFRGETEISLKPREFDLMVFLMRHPGRTFTRDQLLDKVWGADYSGDVRTVDLHVRRLRTKVEEDPSDPRLIQTVWGVGYRLGEEVSA